MAKRFDGKRVFVTAASEGIGFEICRQFLEAGAVVGLNARRQETTLAAVQQLRSQYPRSEVTPFPCDIADVETIQRSIRRFAEENDGLDIFVANAGITVFAPFLDVQKDEFDYLMDVNMRGTYFSVQEAVRQMIQRNIRGRIILMSSVCGFRAHANTSSYGMTKAGIRQLAVSLTDELAARGITINVIAPGATLNERTSEDAEYADGWASVAPTARVGRVEDVAYVTLFLADDRASHISGEVVVVDGGWSITSPLPAYLEKELKGRRNH